MGVILHQLFAGEPPCEAGTVHALFRMIPSDEPRSLAEHRPDLPFHMVRSQHAGTPQPWNESIESHHRVVRVAGKLVLVHATGPAPEESGSEAPAALTATRVTVWLMNLSPDPTGRGSPPRSRCSARSPRG